MENTEITTICIRAVDPRMNNDNLVLKRMVHFHSNLHEQFSVMDAKLDHLLEMAANIQLLVQGLGGVDLCVVEVQSQQQISRKWMPYTIAKLESPSEKLELMQEQHCTKDEEADFLIVETTKMEAQKVFDEMLQSEIKMVCVTETMETNTGTADEVNSGPILPKTVICDRMVGLESKFWKSARKVQRELLGWGIWMKPMEDGGSTYEIEFILSSFLDEAYQRKFSAHLKFCKHVAIKKIIVRKFVGEASRIVWKKKNKEATWSFDPGGGRVFDESPHKKIYKFQIFNSHDRSFIAKSFCLEKKIDAEFVSRICMGVSFADHFVNPRMTDVHSSFRLQTEKVVTLFSKASSFAFLLCNASKNVSLCSVLSLIELRFVTDSKLSWIFQVTATLNIVDLLEIVYLGLVEVDCTKISSYRIISTSIFSLRQSTKYLYNETIHHRILVHWVKELIDCASAIGLSVSKSLPSWRIQLTIESHSSFFNMIYVVAIRSFGVNDSIQAAEPILVFKGLLGYIFTWSVRGALVELGTMFLEKGSYELWKSISWDQIWFCEIIGICFESESFKDDGLTAILSRSNGTCRDRKEFNLSHCKRKLIGVRWFIKDYEAEFGGLYTKDGVEFLSPLDAEGHGTHTSSIAAGAVVENVSFSELARRGAPSARLPIFNVLWAMGSCSSTDISAAFDDSIRIVVNGVTVVVGMSIIMNLGTLVLGHLQLSRGDTTLSRAEYCHVHNYGGIGIKGR